MIETRAIERMQLLLRRLKRRRKVRHVALGISSLDGDWTWSDASGTAGPSGEHMTIDTPWFIASVTKLFIATVTLRLYEEQRIDLEAPITTYLPEQLRRGLHVLDGVDYTDRITPTHLLGHLSGLPDSLDERPRGGRSLVEEVVEDRDRSWGLEEAIALARDRLTPHFPPSDLSTTKPRIRYSDTNYQLLMMIAQQVTGRSVSDIYRELFDRLGLRRTWLPGDEPASPVGEPATVWIGDVPLIDRPRAMRSFGDLYSTTGDLLRFGRSLFRSDAFRDQATLRLMTQRFNRFGFPRGMAALRAPSWPIEYGLGLMRFELSRLLAGGRRLPGLIGHTGSTGSWLWFCPGLGLILVGTVDQASAATVPFRAIPRVLGGL